MSAVPSLARRLFGGALVLAAALSSGCGDAGHHVVVWPSEFSIGFLLERADDQLTSILGPFRSSEAVEAPRNEGRETLLVTVDPDQLARVDPRFDPTQPVQIGPPRTDVAECQNRGLLEDGRLTRDSETLPSVLELYLVANDSFVPLDPEQRQGLSLSYARSPCLGGGHVNVRPAYPTADAPEDLPYAFFPIDDETLLVFFSSSVELRSAGVSRAVWQAGTEPVSGLAWLLGGVSVDASAWPAGPVRALVVARTSPDFVGASLFELEIDTREARGRSLYAGEISLERSGQLFDVVLESSGALLAVGEDILLTRGARTGTIAIERPADFSGRRVLGSGRSGMRHIVGGGGGLVWLGDASLGFESMQQEVMGSASGFSSDQVTSALQLARSGAIYLVSAGRIFRRDPAEAPGDGVWTEQYLDVETPTSCSADPRCGRLEPPKLTRFSTLALDRAAGGDEWFWAQVPDCPEVFLHSLQGACSIAAPLSGRAPGLATSFPAKHRAAQMPSGVLLGFIVEELFHYEHVAP